MRAADHVVELLRSSNLKGVSGSDFAWWIDGTSGRIDELKTRILQVVLEQSPAFVNFDDPPDASLGIRCALKVEKGPKPWWIRTTRWQPYRCVTWEAPKGTSAEGLRAWLYTGNWQFYVADSCRAEFPDLCRASSEFVAFFAEACELEIVIDSFHDDVTWAIGLAPDHA